MDYTLPGLRPDYLRVDFTRTPNKAWTVTIYAADAPGFACARDSETYELLTWDEACDIAEATLRSFSA